MALNIKPVNDNYLNDLVEQLKIHEGYRAKTYKCTSDKLTIGIGFMVSELSLDLDICEEILVRKLKDLQYSIKKKFHWFEDMPPHIKDVVMEMCYQLGVGGFSKFRKTISYLENKQFKNASVEMLDSLWAKQTPNRAKALSNIVKEVV